MRGVTLENLLPRSFKEVAATGNEPVVYNYLDGGGGFSGVPSTIIAPALLFPDVDVRRQTGQAPQTARVSVAARAAAAAGAHRSRRCRPQSPR